MKKDDLKATYEKLNSRYKNYVSQNLRLDMSRGRPSSEQLELSSKIFDCLDKEDFLAANSIDCRNYGVLDGIPEAKKLFSELLEVDTSEIIIGGNSSLNLMYDTIARIMLKGVPRVEIPWSSLPVVKFLCPSPGYDRHFSICENMNIQMITININEYGPDIDRIEQLVKSDESIKGIWCVPMYSNPTGITYSDEVVDRLAQMETKAPDFRIFWDNAYLIHHLSDKTDKLKNILKACKNAGNPDRVFIFSSTSKITFPGAGVAVMASSQKNISEIKKQMSVQTIGFDKLNQLRHVRFLKNMDNINKLMSKHGKILKPRFDIVFDTLEKELANENIASWSKPRGGYFISFNSLDGCASKIVKKAFDAGLLLTAAGATYPYRKDPADKNIRISPSYPSLEDLKKAMDLFCICVKLVTIEKLLKT